MRVLVYLFVFISFVQAQSLDEYLEDYKPTSFSELKKYGATVKDIIYQSAVGDSEIALKFLEKHGHRVTEDEEFKLLEKYGVHLDVIKRIKNTEPRGKKGKIEYAVFEEYKEKYEILNKELEELRKEMKKLRDGRSVPTGTILPFYGSREIPSGFLLCDGRSISRNDYPSLYEHLSKENPSLIQDPGIIKIPDLRGVFLRGLDHKKGYDPNRVLGTFQESENKSHNHNVIISKEKHSHYAEANRHTHQLEKEGEHSHLDNPQYNRVLIYDKGHTASKTDNNDATGSEPNLLYSSALKSEGEHRHAIEPYEHSHNIPENSHLHSADILSEGKNESRPKNIAVNFIIKN